MNIEDIVKIPITNGMVTEAKRERDFLQRKIGAKTRPVYEDRDLVGSLAHQAVEVKFQDLRLGFISSRTQEFKEGDLWDIKYEKDTIDVKGTHAFFDKKYFYNKEFLVFENQLNDSKIHLISHFCFVLIEPSFERAYIYGVIPVYIFLRTSYSVKLQYKNRAVKANRLMPFLNYVHRVRNTS